MLDFSLTPVLLSMCQHHSLRLGFPENIILAPPDSHLWPLRHQKEKDPAPVDPGNGADFCGINAPILDSFKLPPRGHWMGSEEEMYSEGSPAPGWAGAGRWEPGPAHRRVHYLAHPSTLTYRNLNYTRSLLSRGISEREKKVAAIQYWHTQRWPKGRGVPFFWTLKESFIEEMSLCSKTCSLGL